MNTSYRKEGEALAQLIAGNEIAWGELVLEWNDAVINFAIRKFGHLDYENLVQDAWKAIPPAIAKWRPGVDTKRDRDGVERPIHTALTLSYVKHAISGLGQRAIKHVKAEATKSLDAPGGDDAGTLANFLEDREGRGDLLEAGLFELLLGIESQRLDDESLAYEMLTAISDAGLLLPKALEVFMELADPPLESNHSQCLLRRWLLEQSYLEIGRDLNLEFRDQKRTGNPDDRKVTNWASSQHTAALRRVRAGLSRYRRAPVASEINSG